MAGTGRCGAKKRASRRTLRGGEVFAETNPHGVRSPLSVERAAKLVSESNHGQGGAQSGNALSKPCEGIHQPSEYAVLRNGRHTSCKALSFVRRICYESRVTG